MISSLTVAQQSSLNRACRDFGSYYAGGFAQLVGDMLFNISAGEIGIAANAWDVNAAAPPAALFAIDATNTTGLTFAHLGGRFSSGGTVLTVAPGSIALTASATNYVEVYSLAGVGTLAANTAGFTAGRVPLYTIATSGSGIASTTNSHVELSVIAPGSVNGTLLSTSAGSRSLTAAPGTVTATTSAPPAQAPVTGTLTAATLVCPTAVAQSDASYWTVTVTNLGAAGSGTQALLAATAANTTKATGGSAVTANVPHPLTLTTVVTGTELNVNDGDVIVVTFTATGTPPPLTGCSVRLKFTFTG